MIRNILRSAIVIILLSSIGCERRPLVDELTNTALIPVKVFWDLANITAQNATLLAYDQSGSLYLERRFAGSADKTYAETSIELGEGIYTIVVFNEIMGQIDNVQMRGHDNLSTFEAYITPASKVYARESKANGDLIVEHPGNLAVWKGVFTVDKEMVAYTRQFEYEVSSSKVDIKKRVEALTNLHPLLKTVDTYLEAEVKGLNNARMPALVELRNMAGGYFFETDRNNMTPVTFQFFMNNRQYFPNSLTDGTIHTQITTFGVPGERMSVEDIPKPVFKNLLFKLVDKEQTQAQRSFDVTRILKISKNSYQALNIHIKVIVDALPDVDPENSSGMGSDLVDWEGELINMEL